jgi:putative adenylate-forming enzyme
MDIRIIVGLLHGLERLRAHEQWTRPQLEAFQASALARQRAYAYANSPFYQRFHRGLMDRPLQDLPVLTKALMMEHFDDLVTDRAIRRSAAAEHIQQLSGDERFLDRYWVAATSGSSGQPGMVLFNRREWTTILASFARAHAWGGQHISLTHRMKIASVASSSPWHMSTRVGATLKSWWTPTLRLAATQPLAAIAEQLNAWQPEILITYASMGRSLADAQLAGRLTIQPRIIFTSSEVLTAATRQRLEAAWGDRVFNEYATTETGSLAAEWQADRALHLFEDLLIVEVVDADNRPVPPGVAGARLLVTTLFSRTQPLIRYELNDRICLSADPGPSVLPFARIEHIAGRLEEALSLPALAGGTVAIHPVLFEGILDALPISGWQVVQAGAQLTLLLAGSDSGAVDDAAVSAAVTAALARQGVLNPAVSIAHMPAIPRTAAGKTPQIRVQPPVQ